MRCCIFAFVLALFPSLARGDNPCQNGRGPDYLRVGADRSDSLDTLVCRDDSEFANGTVTIVGDGAVVENKIVTPGEIAEIASRLGHVELRRCRILDAIDFGGLIRAALVFDQCEFQGSVNIRYAGMLGGLSIRDSVFHQDFTALESRFEAPLFINGAVFASRFTVETCRFDAGINVLGARFVGDVLLRDVQSPTAVVFSDTGFVRNLTAVDLELLSALRFRDCTWPRTSLIAISGGSIGGGVRFDSCAYEATWLAAGVAEHVELKLTDVSLGAPLVIARPTSSEVPRLLVSRSVMPYIKVPEWPISRYMVPQTGKSIRELEEGAELLQLISNGFELEGRTRSAEGARSDRAALVARIKGVPSVVLQTSVVYFGSGMWWFVGAISILVTLFAAMRRRWSLVADGAGRWVTSWKIIVLSVRALVWGVEPEKYPSAARHVFHIAKAVGVIFFFFLGNAVSEWMRVN